jgi:hypothetical protein
VGDSQTKDVKISVSQTAGGSSTGLENPFTIVSGTGLSIAGAGQFDGRNQKTFTFSIGQDVGTTSTVQFANVSASSALHIGETSFEIKQRDDGKAEVSTDWVVKGDIIAENFVVTSSVTSMSVQQASGSTRFGDSADDTHRITGSMSVAGNLTVNGSTLITATTVTNPDLYLRKTFVKKANSITIPSTASFSAVTASAPSGLTATNEQDFVFFINGQYMGTRCFNY